MKRLLLLLTCAAAAACDARAPSPIPPAGPEPATPEMPGQIEPGPVSSLIPPEPPLFATQTGNPPVATCSPSPDVYSLDDCEALAAQLQRFHAQPRQVRYVAGDVTTDLVRFSVADDPFSLSYCVAPEQAPSWLRPAAVEPVCLCASAPDDRTPVALGRFGGTPSSGAELECGHQRLLDGELQRTCLYDRDEFPGCDPGNADSCAETCGVFRGRAIQYATAIQDVSIRTLRVARNPSNPCAPSACQIVFQLGEQCFAQRLPLSGCAGPQIGGPARDCAFTDDELLREAGLTPAPLVDSGPTCEPPPVADAGASAADAGTIPQAADSGTAGDAG